MRLLARDEARRLESFVTRLLAQLGEPGLSSFTCQSHGLASLDQFTDLRLHLIQWSDRRGPVVQNAGRHQRVGGNLDRLRVAPVLQRVLSEDGVDHARGDEGRNSLPGHCLDCANLQIEFLSCRLQRVGLLVHDVGELIGRFSKSLLRLLLLQVALDIGADLLERLGLRGLDGGQPNDVKAEVRLDDVADLAFLQFERNLFERLDHHAPAEKAEIAALGRRAAVLRVFAREFFEVDGLCPDLCENFIRLLAGGRLVGALGGQQDVTRAALLLGTVARLVLVVIGPDVGFGNRSGTGNRFRRKYQVLDLHVLGRFEQRPILLVKLRDLCIGDLHLGQELLRSKTQLPHLALLAQHAFDALGHLLRHDRRLHDCLHQRLFAHVLAHALVEHRTGHSLRGQERVVTLGAELALFLERRDAHDHIPQSLVGDDDVGFPRLVGQRPIQYETFENHCARFGRLEHLRIEVLAKGLPQPLDTVTQCRIEFLLRDGGPVHGRQPAFLLDESVVALDPEEDEGRENEHQHEEHQPAAVRADGIEHVCLPTLKRESDYLVEMKKANSRSPFVFVAEWTGLEPATPGVTGRYSNRLNYHSPSVSMLACRVSLGGC